MQPSPGSKFLRSNFGVCLVYYDTRRGQVEGQEAEKVLAFYPPTTPATTQSSLVGLSQALTMFAGTFNKECPFHIMEAENTLWCMYHCEPDLWLLMLVSRASCAPTLRPASLQAYVRALHGMTTLLHGTLTQQLQSDASAAAVRRRLCPLLQEAAGQLLRPELHQLSALGCPLGMQAGVPFLPVSETAFTRLQSLVNQLLVSSLYGTRLVTGVLVAYQQCLLWSSLKQVDSLALFHLASHTIIPAAKAGPKHRTMRSPLAGAAGGAAAAAGEGASAGLQSSSSSSSRGSHSLLHAACWGLQPHGWVSPVAGCTSDGMVTCAAAAAAPGGAPTPPPPMSLPVSSSASTNQQEAGGGYSPAAAEAEGGSQGHQADSALHLPRVWLEGAGEHSLLLPWHYGPLVVLLLLQDVPASAQAGTPAGLLQVLRAGGPPLLRQLSAELPAKHLWHVKGVRYLYHDAFAGATRASPLSKVATLSLPSLGLAAAVRDAADLEASCQDDPTAAAPLEELLGCGARPAAAAAGAGGGGMGAGGMLTDSSSGAVERQVLESPEWGEWAAGVALGDVEVAVKGANEAWAVARHAAPGRELCVVVEGDREVRGLGGALSKVNAFCDAYCQGAFEGVSAR